MLLSYKIKDEEAVIKDTQPPFRLDAPETCSGQAYALSADPSCARVRMTHPHSAATEILFNIYGVYMAVLYVRN